MLRIAIVDDHQIVRAGFREMLADELDFEFAFEAATGEEALAGLRAHETDVLLLDLCCPGRAAWMCCAPRASATTGCASWCSRAFPRSATRCR